MEDEFELSTVCHRPEGLEQLQEQTKFTRKELQVLYRGFKNVSVKTGQTGREVGQEGRGVSRTCPKGGLDALGSKRECEAGGRASPLSPLQTEVVAGGSGLFKGEPVDYQVSSVFF